MITLDLERGLVGGDLAEDVADGNRVALFLQPLVDGRDLDGLAEFR